MSTIPPPSTHAATILVATPDPALRALVCAMLHFSGYRSLPTATPREAIEAAGEHGVEGVFLDLDHPGLTLEALLRPPASGPAPDWLQDRDDLSGRLHLILCGHHRPSPNQAARAGELGKSVSFLGLPFGLHPFRAALSLFAAEHPPSPARPAGATGTLLALPSRDDVAPPPEFRDPRAGSYGGPNGSLRGAEHRRDIRFEWSCGAVLLGKTEERVEICEVSRTGLRVRKSGRELVPGTHCEISFVARLESARGADFVGVRALGQVVWAAEGPTWIEAGITLHAVQPLPEYIALLVSLYRPRA